MPAYKNTSTQNLNTLAYNATGINNSQDKISDTMTALYKGIDQWGVMDLQEVTIRITQGNITLDTYIAFQPPIGGDYIVDTPRHIFEVYA